MESFAKILCFCGITFCLGGSLAMTGVSVYHATLWFYKSQTFLSLIFICKAFGCMIGSIIAWWFFKRTNQVIVSVFSLLGLAVTVLAFPTTSGYIYLFALLVLHGVCVGLFKNSFHNLLGINYSKNSFIHKVADVFFSLGYIFTIAIIIFFCNPPFDHPSFNTTTTKPLTVPNGTRATNNETSLRQFKRSVDINSFNSTNNINDTAGFIETSLPTTSVTTNALKLEATTISSTKSLLNTTTTLSNTTTLFNISTNNTNDTTSTTTTTTSTHPITRPEFIDSNNDNHHKNFASGQSIKHELKESLKNHPIDADLKEHQTTLPHTTPPTNHTSNTTVDGNATIAHNYTMDNNTTSTLNYTVVDGNNSNSSISNTTANTINNTTTNTTSNTTITSFLGLTTPQIIPIKPTTKLKVFATTRPTTPVTTIITATTFIKSTTTATTIHDTPLQLPTTSTPTTTTTSTFSTTKSVNKVSNIDTKTTKNMVSKTPVSTHPTGNNSGKFTTLSHMETKAEVTPHYKHKAVENEDDVGLKLKIVCLEWVDATANQLTFHNIPYFLGFIFISFIMLITSAFLFFANRNSSKIMLYRHTSDNAYSLAGSGHLSTLLLTPFRMFVARCGVFIFYFSFSSFEVLLAGVFMVFFLSIPGAGVTVSLVGCLMLWLFHFAGKIFLIFLVSTITSTETLNWIGALGMLLSCLCYYPIFYHPSNQTIDCLPLSLVIFSTSFFFSFINPSIIDNYNKLNVLPRINIIQHVASFLGELTTPGITTYLILSSDIDYFLHSIFLVSFLLFLSICVIHLSLSKALTKKQNSRKKNDQKVMYKKRNFKKTSFDNGVLITNEDEDDDDYEVSNDPAINGHSTTKPLLLD